MLRMLLQWVVGRGVWFGLMHIYSSPDRIGLGSRFFGVYMVPQQNSAGWDGNGTVATHSQEAPGSSLSRGGLLAPMRFLMTAFIAAFARL